MTRAKHALSPVKGMQRRQGQQQVNSKREIRNSQQIQMTKKQIFKQASFGFGVSDFLHLKFDCKFVSDFDIRILEFFLAGFWAR
jgi:hypothetical protein